MEQQIIDWLIAIVEHEDKREALLEETSHALRADGKRLVVPDLSGDTYEVWDVATGEVIERDGPNDWHEQWVTPAQMMKELDETYPSPKVPTELRGIVNEDVDPGVARKWINENVMPL